MFYKVTNSADKNINTVNMALLNKDSFMQRLIKEFNFKSSSNLFIWASV